MHSGAKARMRSEVIGRISKAADDIGQASGVENYVDLQSKAPRAKDPEVQRLHELSAVAELLEDLASAESPQFSLSGHLDMLRFATDEQLLELEGIGKVAVRKLREALS